jgi:hypothetical protein
MAGKLACDGDTAASTSRRALLLNEARRTLVPRVTGNIDLIFITSARRLGRPPRDRPEHHRCWCFDAVYALQHRASYSGQPRSACYAAPRQARTTRCTTPLRRSAVSWTNYGRPGSSRNLIIATGFGHFRGDLERRGELEAAPQPTAGARIAMRSTAGDHDDYDVLHGWWQRRVAAKQPRVALYYNTISLHDGNRLPDAAGGWQRSYPRRARTLLDDIDRFLEELEASGARAIVVVIPEHGAAFHAARGEIAGLRQIPSPKVTDVRWACDWSSAVQAARSLCASTPASAISG